MTDYHWNELWRSLLGLVNFLHSKSEDMTDLNGITELANNLVEVLAASLTGGETFLPGTTDYDDLFYKLVQATNSLEKFSQLCNSKHFGASNIRFWKTSVPWNDNIIKCLQTLSIATIRASESLEIATFVFGGGYKSN